MNASDLAALNNPVIGLTAFLIAVATVIITIVYFVARHHYTSLLSRNEIIMTMIDRGRSSAEINCVMMIWRDVPLQFTAESPKKVCDVNTVRAANKDLPEDCLKNNN